MADSENIAAVQRLYGANGDPDVIRSTLAPEVRWEVVEGFPYSGVYEGADGVLDGFFAKLMSDFDDWGNSPEEIIEAGDRVIGVGCYSGRARNTGKRFSARFAHVWTVENGKIVRLRQCADTVQIARALEP